MNELEKELHDTLADARVVVLSAIALGHTQILDVKTRPLLQRIDAVLAKARGEL